MPGRVYQVEKIFPAIRFIFHLDGMALDCDPPLPFQIHAVKNLIMKIPFGYRIGPFKKPVGQGAFAMVYMGYNAEVTNIVHQGRG